MCSQQLIAAIYSVSSYFVCLQGPPSDVAGPPGVSGEPGNIVCMHATPLNAAILQQYGVLHISVACCRENLE